MQVVRRGIYHIDDGVSWRHGATEPRRQIRLDGRAQGGGAVWRRGDVDGRGDWQDLCSDSS